MEALDKTETCVGEKLRVLELYSGIGGMHLALKESGLKFEVVAAVDINTVTNAVYKHNFPHVDLKQRSIESLSLKEVNKLSPDMILMSPPCQPFTRVGKQKDCQDVRTTSFFHVLDLLPSLERPPKYILVENVKGFDSSQTRENLLKTLAECEYHVQEFLVTPLQFGIPNSRLRYYLLAKKAPLKFNFPMKNQIHEEVPECAVPFCVHRLPPSAEAGQKCDTVLGKERSASNTTLTCHNCTKESLQSCVNCDSTKKIPSSCTNNSLTSTSSHVDLNNSGLPSDSTTAALELESCDESCDSSRNENDEPHQPIALYKKYSSLCRPIRHFLESEAEEYFKPYMLPEKFYKTFWVADIVKSAAQNSCCFTKRYGHYMDGAGSLLQMNENPTFDLVKFKDTGIYGEEAHELVRALKLRYFTPRETANLLCFPKDFGFPPELSLVQCYRCLGNSLNVHVVSVLLRLLTLEPS